MIVANGPRAMPRGRRAHAGFTLVELVAVMIITGILAAVAMPRFFERNSFDGRAFADQTRATLRYAHKLAIAQHRNVHVRLNGASVALCYVASCDTALASNLVLAPNGGNSASAATLAACGNSNSWFCEAVPSGITMPTDLVTGLAFSFQFFFDPEGKPYNAGDDGDTALSTFGAGAPQIVRVTGADATVYDITIEPETGYVH